MIVWKLAFAYLICLPLSCPAEDVVFEDFEAGQYQNWVKEGEAFGNGPAAGTLPNQQAVGDFLGKGLVNTYLNGDRTTGALTSRPFELSHQYIAFLIGGGNHPGKTGIELLVEGKAVRQATGDDREALDWRLWDVREFRGKEARLRLFDSEQGGWGHVNVDHILLTDNPHAGEVDLAAYRNSGDYYREPYRPQVHFSPEVNWMNDPNGLVFFDGEYHLFYQYNPFGKSWGHMSWGHAVSGDLVHWRHLPVALYEEDGAMIFSGSAVVDEKNSSGFGEAGRPPLVAIYTAHRPGNQSQALAYSNDRGRTWTKYAGNPVLDVGEADFRDPKVFWHEPSRQWVMAVALAAQKRVQFYGSTDLRKWKLLSEFGPAGASEAPNWECPDLFELPVEGQPGKSKWVLHISIGSHAVAGGSGGQYFVGEFDGRTFVPDEPRDRVRWVDHGRDFYAAVSWSDIPPADGRRLWIGWMNNWETNVLPTHPWRSAMSLPRSLSLRQGADGLQLIQRPVVELNKLRGEKVHVDAQDIADGAPIEVIQAADGGDALEIIAEFALGSASEVGLEVGKGSEQTTRIGYSTGENRLFLDRTRSGRSDFHPAFAGRHSGPLTPLEGNRVKLHLFVDRSSVEAFGNDGEVVITDLIFPDETSNAVQLYARGGNGKLLSLDVWKLRSIWHDQ